ncbi:MAG: threonylcarbamoyl-AMP synthase [Candidatus Staskawiczbacteria bacterium RIFOXYD1_FULL_39_28]|uniref:L-threonylcarbamoyladenylate synthase n=1 Tax=Candidatus Staskawiczbacteria bacterium RIFOXYC1_FULL_38_18 TaxID=1802229 RepID=A0A1G2JD12_9BACT|nr:MAG: threonylcarbamoyl-AMP synthase [Candidatus Staskawiczbacteria bacterium RIFOXYC1_FULL_38_18]OGZ91470.1 MAG: threonylcarbamoyl-AMP synthase [Candidatus Staskawiczbacteria bacterium RIFOXYD1_FULL_39_28]
MQVLKMSQKPLSKAVAALKKGKILICPTDTVYGFLADASNKKAVGKIYKIKKRPRSKPLAVFVKDLKMTKELAEINAKQEKIIKQKWPGKYTFVLNKKNKKSTIALRIPKYKFLNDLLKTINKPLAQTSVNISGQSPMSKISDIINQFRKSDVLIIDAGNLKKSKPSKIVDLTGKTLTRLR